MVFETDYQALRGRAHDGAWNETALSCVKNGERDRPAIDVACRIIYTPNKNVPSPNQRTRRRLAVTCRRLERERAAFSAQHSVEMIVRQFGELRQGFP